MSEKYSDEKIKSILEEREVPDELSPDNIKVMLDKFGHESRRKHKIKNNIVKISSLAAAALAVIIGVNAIAYPIGDKCGVNMKCRVETADNDHTLELADNMRYAKSYEDVYDYFNLSNVGVYKNYITDEEMDMGDVAEYAPINGFDEGVMENDGIAGEEYNDEISGVQDELKTAGGSESNSDENYTNTYNQEEGVIEADIVKTDGKNIFYVSENKIRAAQVDKGKFTKMETFAEDIGYINEIYLYNDILIAISDNIFPAGEDYYEYSDKNSTLITIYSKEDHSVIGQYQQKGYFNDVRLRDDGFMYLVTNESDDLYNCGNITEKDTEKYIPSYLINDEEYQLKCSDILISDISSEDSAPWVSYINISAFDLNSSEPYTPSDVKAIAGNSGIIYCSMENLYVTYGWEKTEITRFEIGEGRISPKAGTKIKGHINDQFSMSEYNGYFRIATSISDNWFTDSNNALYVLDMELEEIGKITDFGIDESIKSVNFNGDMAYIVTFRQTDPLYAIDLSDPANPKKTDELKITGYSSYMQNWSDGMLFGFGESGDEDGNLNGIKLTMFDNSDPDNLKVIDSVEINDTDEQYNYSSALYDRKALLISPKNNIIGIPVNTDVPYYSTYHGKHSYKFYSFENGTLKELGELSKTMKIDYFSEFNRSIIIDGFVYIFSNDTFMAADIKDFKQTDSFTFNIDNDDIIYNDGIQDEIPNYEQPDNEKTVNFESYISNNVY